MSFKPVTRHQAGAPGVCVRKRQRDQASSVAVARGFLRRVIRTNPRAEASHAPAAVGLLLFEDGFDQLSLLFARKQSWQVGRSPHNNNAIQQRLRGILTLEIRAE